MKAVVLHTHGGPEVLEYSDHPLPNPGPRDVLIKLEAAAVNRLDIWVRDGWPGIRLDYPHILGADGAGTIHSIGRDIEDWTPGDRVVINSNIGCGKCKFCIAGKDNQCRHWNMLGETVPGTYAEYVTIPAKNIYSLPDGFDPHEAAAAALVYHTAWHSLISRGNLRPGESVLVVGASGGVNLASIQVAKFAGAIVFVVGSNPQKLSLAATLGADYLIDRSQEEDWAKTVYNKTDHYGVDVVVDNVGTTFPLSMRAASKGGRIHTVGNTGGTNFEIDNRYIFGKHLTIIGSTMGTRDDFAKVMDLIFTRKLKVVLDKKYPLSEVRSAHERLEKGEQMGKITLEIAPRQ
jgi:NADPH:quinone reductase-like Zn-dependent oxidoreductase